MRDDPPPCSFQTLFSGSESTSWLRLTSDPRMRALAADYRPWRKFQYVAREKGLEPVPAWRAAKFIRLQTHQPLPDLARAEGGPFGVSLGAQLLEPLHRIDRATGGGGAIAFDADRGILGDETVRTRFRIRTLMDEAAESSIIEGASGTRKDAVELLRSGRKPKHRGERMIVNNYAAMQLIKEWRHLDLDVEKMLELQRTLTDGTLDDPTDSGRFRRSSENVRVVDERDETTIFVPPPADQLPVRLERLCRFANTNHTGDRFLHPLIKACILHFMLGYEHPFVDGNGRTARALFYWFALRHRYDIFEYLTISQIIRKGYSRYPQAYVDTEVDDGDLTYFVLYKLDIIEQSLDQLAEHLTREERRLRESERLLRLAKDLNLRQRLLLEHSLRHPHTLYTVNSHMRANNIARNTARADLDDLVRRRMMTTTSRGKEVIYLVTPGVSRRLAGK